MKLPFVDWFREPRKRNAAAAAVGVKKLLGRDEADRVFSAERVGPLGVVFCAALIAVTVFILDYGVLPPAYRVRSRAPSDIAARVSFQYNDADALARLREEKASQAPNVYVEDPAWTDQVLRDLRELISIVEEASSVEDAKAKATAAHFQQDLQLVEELVKQKEESGARFLSGILLERIRASLQNIAKSGVLSEEDVVAEHNKAGSEKTIVRVTAAQNGADAQTAMVDVHTLRSVSNAFDEFKRKNWKENINPALERQVALHLSTRVTARANLKIDKNLSDSRKAEARTKIGSGEIQVAQGDVILSKDSPIRPSEVDKLHEEYRAYKSSLSSAERIKHVAGLATLVFGVLLVFIFVSQRIQPEIWKRRQALVMLAVSCITTLLIARGLMLEGYSLAFTPFVFIGIVASLAFGQAIALLTLIAMTILTAFVAISWEALPFNGGIPALSIAMMAGGIAAALPPEKLNGRWDLLKYGAFGGIVQGGLVAGFGLLAGGAGLGGAAEFERFALQWPRAGLPQLSDSLIALANGPLCGLLVLGALPLVESLFNVLTNIRLTELTDMNQQPALKRLQLEAPGTFTHTLHVRFLAEPAAEAIGANVRLVSAGVLYHDLGKVLKPEYFVENQMGAEELHRRLRPSVSALLITAHVKDGIELAREYRLPQQIIDFIPQHHGTTLVTYFYHSAKKSAEAQMEDGDHDVSEELESFFRYPGPKPETRETAVVMLADTVEAATRTLENPSAARLRTFIHELIMDKMLDRQLDECNLTFKDLALIEDAFVRVLVTRFHSRVRYPGQEAEHAGAHETRTATPAKASTVRTVPQRVSPVVSAERERTAPSADVLLETPARGTKRPMLQSGKTKK